MVAPVCQWITSKYVINGRHERKDTYLSLLSVGCFDVCVCWCSTLWLWGKSVNALSIILKSLLRYISLCLFLCGMAVADGMQPETTVVILNEEEGEAPGPEDEDSDADTGEAFRVAPTDDRLADVFAAVDAAIAQADRALAGENNGRRQPQPERDPLVYDLDWDEDERLDAWRAVVDQTRNLPPALAAAIAADAWRALEPLQHSPWLGRLLAAALLRARGKARSHLPCLHDGLKAIPRERRRPPEAASRLAVQLEAIAAAAEAGLKDHDRWLTARTLLARKLDGRRSTSRLPALLDYVLTRPVVSAGMIAEELKVTPRAAQDMVAELGLREATGRGRYRAWGIL